VNRDVIEDEPVEEGLPMYMGTFADLMALLMIFFVLLFSFSELDALKFKMVVQSMESAFGVQKSVPLPEIPKGTSIIAQEYSPGIPAPTLIRTIEQQTTDDTREFLESCSSLQEAQEVVDRERMKQLMLDASQLRIDLKEEIEAGFVKVDTLDDRVVIRVEEKGSFKSGDAKIAKSFLPVVHKISQTINKSNGNVMVSGHTDNIPINTPRYPSNWELSSARATSIVRAMIAFNVDPFRLSVEGRADTQSLEKNSTSAGRAKNRRVEINIM